MPGGARRKGWFENRSMQRKRATSCKAGGNPPGAGRYEIMALYLACSERNEERIKGGTADSEEQPSWLFIRGFINKIGIRLCAGVMEIPNAERAMWASQPGACLLSELKRFSLVLRFGFA